MKYKFNFGTFFINLIDAAICAFIEYCIYHVVALLIGALASITQHTKATAKLLEYQLSKGEPVDVAENEWQCKKCGSINSDYTETCACGNTKAENADIGIDNTSSQRFCENCGAELSDDASFCPSCGAKQNGKVFR